MEKNETLAADSRLLKQKADDIYYLERKIEKYKSELAEVWKGTDFRAVEKEINALEKRLERISADLEGIAADYLKSGQGV